MIYDLKAPETADNPHRLAGVFVDGRPLKHTIYVDTETGLVRRYKENGKGQIYFVHTDGCDNADGWQHWRLDADRKPEKIPCLAGCGIATEEIQVDPAKLVVKRRG